MKLTSNGNDVQAKEAAAELAVACGGRERSRKRKEKKQKQKQKVNPGEKRECFKIF